MLGMFAVDGFFSPFINVIPVEYEGVIYSIIFTEGFVATLILILVYENTYETLQQEQQQGQQKTKYMATHDQLTGIANRSYFYSFLENLLLKNKKPRTDKQLAFIYIDLVGFKQVNDKYGHQTGDILLQALAKKIERGVRKQDMVARHGGDEFVILLNGIKHENDLISIADKLVAMISETVNVEGVELNIYPSMGISLFPTHTQDLIELERLADEAMYEAKSNKTAWKIYNGSSSVHALASPELSG
jgi:diguanylate cyclase (GGDEF)-like protein